ncbi:unnamed protein product [Psylliodes chrysocephalus]|uniref:Uncharacterized protein n=1 Tax=Psylliodes chrysocephalus TaxID=3402493 RepID=A0A9P0GKY2_9CUCU|nr:unnamed protein product [Psylliodes chrysocephala]
MLKHQIYSKEDVEVDKQYPCTVELHDNHNHRVDVADALRERPLGPDAKQELLHLFEKVHSAGSAYHTFYATNMELYGNKYNEKNFYRFYFPTKSDVRNLWQKTLKQQYGERTEFIMLKKLQEILSSKNGTLFKIVQVGDQYAASISTPLMQSAQKLPQVLEILFVHATGNCDLQDHKVYSL